MTTTTTEQAFTLKKTDMPGVFTAHRTESEKPFAELHSPKAMGIRKWGIKYRGEDSTAPFAGNYINSYPATKQLAVDELKRTMLICSDFQLGLASQAEAWQAQTPKPDLISAPYSRISGVGYSVSEFPDGSACLTVGDEVIDVSSEPVSYCVLDTWAHAGRCLTVFTQEKRAEIAERAGATDNAPCCISGIFWTVDGSYGGLNWN